MLALLSKDGAHSAHLAGEMVAGRKTHKPAAALLIAKCCYAGLTPHKTKLMRAAEPLSPSVPF